MDFQILQFTDQPDEQLINLLNANQIGTPGISMIYQHLHIEEKLKSVPKPVYVKLAIRDHLLGMVCFSRREVRNGSILKSAAYIRYFTFKESFRSGPGSKENKKGQGIIRKEIEMLMNGRGLESYKPSVLYAYVDSRNIRSKRIIKEFGLKKIGTFSVMIFSRLFPKAHTNVQLAKLDDQAFILKSVNDFYQKEQLVNLENLFFKGKYFLYRENGEIICGAQAIPEQWAIKDLPGFSGKILMNIVPHIPLLKRLFNPDYHFILIEGIFCKKGHERKLEMLFSAMLSYYKVYSALFCIDPRSDIYTSLKALNLGLIHHVQKETSQDIVVKNLDNADLDMESPVYISGFDVL